MITLWRMHFQEFYPAIDGVEVADAASLMFCPDPDQCGLTVFEKRIGKVAVPIKIGGFGEFDSSICDDLRVDALHPTNQFCP